MRHLLLAAVASVGLVGCVGQLDNSMGGVGSGSGTNPNPTPNSMARMMFEQNVYPIIHNPNATSDCSSCHTSTGPAGNVTGFVAPDVTEAYATATSFQSVVGNFTPATAGILTQVNNGHKSRVFTADQKAAVTAWLAQEVTERAGVGTGSGSGSESPAAATARVLNNFSACMTLTNFTSANMATAWGTMQTNGGARCESCHATGAQGFMATEIAETGTGGPGLFTTITTNEYYMVQYFTVDLSGGTAAAKVIINHVSFDGVSKAQPPHTEHPQFDATNNQGMTALKSFYDLTQTAITAGNCGATKLNPPAQ